MFEEFESSLSVTHPPNRNTYLEERFCEYPRDLRDMLSHRTQFPHMTVNDITYQVRGAIFDVYKGLGPGLLESVYEEALVFELEQRGLKVETQKQVPIVYKGNVLKTELRLDLIVEDSVIVELKSVDEMKKVFYKQLLTYLRLMNKKVGLLVNFKTDDIQNSIYRIANGAD